MTDKKTKLTDEQALHALQALRQGGTLFGVEEDLEAGSEVDPER